MISSEASEVERRLATAAKLDPLTLREYLFEVFEERLYGRNTGERKTGYRFQRGTHGGTYVRDSEGNDFLPVGYEPPPETP